LSNIILLLFLGITLETVHKFYRVAPVFIGGIIAGSLSVSVLDPEIYLLGSSGGVFALFAAHFSDVLLV
jgi:rhomboid-related protein 1/2/3